MVITKDSDSFNPGSSPGRTFLVFFLQSRNYFKNRNGREAALRSLQGT